MVREGGGVDIPVLYTVYWLVILFCVYDKYYKNSLQSFTKNDILCGFFHIQEMFHKSQNIDIRKITG